MLSLPEELIDVIIDHLIMKDKKSILNACKIYHRKKLKYNYIIFGLFSDDHGYPQYDVVSVCDTLDKCRFIIKSELLAHPGYSNMNQNNLYTYLEIDTQVMVILKIILEQVI